MGQARTCADCHFRVLDLCALPRTEICATFRPSSKAGLTPPVQAPLVERPAAPVAAHTA
ncbi:MAG: hypothetical protein RL190_462 [Actinomycetota bacterium]